MSQSSFVPPEPGHAPHRWKAFPRRCRTIALLAAAVLLIGGAIGFDATDHWGFVACMFLGGFLFLASFAERGEPPVLWIHRKP
jgi:hypothetical protein